MKAYYKPLIGRIQEVEVITINSYPNLLADSPSFFYKYLIRLENGKLKEVTENRIIKIKEEKYYG